jgi:hypothetical protein
VGTSVGIVVDADAAGEAVGDAWIAVGPGVSAGLGAADDDPNCGEAGVLAHAARRTPRRRRDTARRFGFTCGLRCCGSSRR